MMSTKLFEKIINFGDIKYVWQNIISNLSGSVAGWPFPWYWHNIMSTSLKYSDIHLKESVQH